MFVTAFGPGYGGCVASDAGEDLILTMIEHSKRLEIDTGDVASLLALELVASLSAYGRASLADILSAIATSAPTRETLLREANRLGRQPPPLNTARLVTIAPSACRLH
jgi:hypothetical protein